MPNVSSISGRSSGAHDAISASMSIATASASAPNGAAIASASPSCDSSIASTRSIDLFVSRKHGTSCARTSTSRSLRKIGTPSASTAWARSNAATSATIALSPLFAARRCLSSRCSTVARSATTSSSSSPSRSPCGSAGPIVPSWARTTKQIASQLRSSPRNLAPRPSPGFEPGGNAMWASWNPAGTTFFDADITASCSSRSSATCAMPSARSNTPGSGSPVERAEQQVRARIRPTYEPDVLHRGQGIDRMSARRECRGSERLFHHACFDGILRPTAAQEHTIGRDGVDRHRRLDVAPLR